MGKYDNKSTSEQPERRDEEAGKKRRIAAFDLVCRAETSDLKPIAD